MVENCVIDAVINKYTKEAVCLQYLNKTVKSIDATCGKELKVYYDDDSFFTHEIVIECNQDDYGIWIETTNKLWRIDWIYK